MLTLVSPAGPSNSTCGYCSPPGVRSAEKTFAQKCGLVGLQMSVTVYKQLIDRGFRRSGKFRRTWCYLPNLPKSCCPLYTIRLDVSEFKLSKSKRKLVNRWNKFILGGKQPTEKEFVLTTTIHAAENDSQSSDHKFEVILEPASYSDDKFKLFCKYQEIIHHDPKNTPSSFRRFLVETPLRPSPIPYTTTQTSHLPEKYGSYHQLYKCDGVLIAVAVLDILPGCVSSVYFFYDPDWDKHSLGKLSALREAALAAEIHAAGAPEQPYLYMGYYVHSCVKMRYKADYLPSYLADPDTFEWFPIDSVCIPLLEKYRYACFSDPAKSTNEDPRQVAAEERQIPPELLSEVNAVTSIEKGVVRVVPVTKHPIWEEEEDRLALTACIAGMGNELAKEVILYLE
ncbi:Arginyl-tRNA--protein transferase 1 [Mycena indigotica]|uniref:Arginyl-tRNA--protein transferase 1 n=1 Tax=Mycena indigotica TaxID=2126181 RepID=A0A8H6SMI5_9AGAR|nr:Arginyl-tRNA--protein transferase 1 [Mycena indigotica]KAF7301376.1 Arginyl-tRNA--protein transferase 1 [Mycena indigotica]